MSKSLKRVTAALDAAGLDPQIVRLELAGTAAQAAAGVGASPARIVKSMLFLATTSDRLVLFLTSGDRNVDLEKASRTAGEPLTTAGADLVRTRSGFAIGGVAPVGHLSAPLCFIDPALFAFEHVWAAAGTPHHVFAISPKALQRITGAVTADFTRARPSP